MEGQFFLEHINDLKDSVNDTVCSINTVLFVFLLK